MARFPVRNSRPSSVSSAAADVPSGPFCASSSADAAAGAVPSEMMSSRIQVRKRSRISFVSLVGCCLAVFLVATHPASAQLKFAALGNWGFESSSSQMVADTLKKVASTDHISFIASPGSNFAGGVTGLDDPKWKTLYEDVYGDAKGSLKMPFFTVLGGEDWSANYTAQALRTELTYAVNSDKLPVNTTAAAPNGEVAANATVVEEAVQEKKEFPKWTLPNWWYHYLMHFPANTGGAFINSGHKDMSVGMIFIDTWVLSSSFPFSNVTSKAWADLEKTLDLAPKILDYIIVVADRPVYSSGSSKGDSMLQYYLEPLLKKANIDAYISGYDFNLEVISEKDVSHVSCGAGSFGAGSAIVKHSGSLFYSGQPGFCLFELTADGLVTKLIGGSTGEVLFTHTQPLKKRPERKSIDAFNFVTQLPEVKYWPVPAMGKMPGRDVFVRVVGTIGLCIATFFLTLSVASGVSRYMK
ncbi:acid phosphatase [Cystoisospora suis]|uniref:acid phosphatase n=1 Tax=Cystoisospora suis TaxID=483139 RepID=A0A2C6LCP2_9APIC|nr:acid phosphatase [Cystoisospora suis]